MLVISGADEQPSVGRAEADNNGGKTLELLAKVSPNECIYQFRGLGRRAALPASSVLPSRQRFLIGSEI
jgi:hypothetical protein